MYSFSGEISAKTDVKGRLFVPAHFRKQLPENGDERLVLRINNKLGFLDVYPESVWKEEVALIEQKLNLLDDDDYLFYMRYTSSAETVEVDSNGRILIPKKILEKVHIKSEVLILGVTRKITIWGKEKYEQNMLSDDEFDRMRKEKLGNK